MKITLLLHYKGTYYHSTYTESSWCISNTHFDFSWFMSRYLECYRQVSTERPKMGSDHSVKQSWTCHTNLAEQCDRLWWSLSFFRLVRVRADQKFDLRRVHPLLKYWAQISLRFWLILVCMYVAKTLKYLHSDSLGTERIFIECFNDPSITAMAGRKSCPPKGWQEIPVSITSSPCPKLPSKSGWAIYCEPTGMRV